MPQAPIPDFSVIEEVPDHRYLDKPQSYRYRQTWYNESFTLHVCVFAKTVEKIEEIANADTIAMTRNNTALKIENTGPFNANLTIIWDIDNPSPSYKFDKLHLSIPGLSSNDPQKIEKYQNFVLDAIDAYRDFSDILQQLFP